MVAAKVANLPHGGDRPNQTANLQHGQTRAQVAQLLNVSEHKAKAYRYSGDFPTDTRQEIRQDQYNSVSSHDHQLTRH
jgi:hypothetical protein